MSRWIGVLVCVLLTAFALCSSAMADDAAGRLGKVEATPASASGDIGSNWFAMGEALAKDTVKSNAAANQSGGDGSSIDPAQAMAPASESTENAANDQDLLPDEKPWEVKAKVYAWIPSIKGHAGIGGRTSRLDISYCDVINALDKVESMAPVNLEVRIGRFGAFFDLFYVRLEDSVRRGPIKVKLKADQTILEIGGFYRAGIWQLNPRHSSSLTFDILGGARYNNLSGSIGLQAPHHALALGRTEEWWDPFVGPRVNWKVTDKFNLLARGDVGGFGIENCSKFVWQFVGAAQYDITRNFFVELGYRLLDTDFERGSGRNHFVYDVCMAGPYLALGIKF